MPASRYVEMPASRYFGMPASRYIWMPASGYFGMPASGYFGMSASRCTFHRIVDHLAEKVERREYKGGRPQLTLEKQILIALWYFANTECYRSIASRFDVSMPGVVGAIDGTHIAIPGPNQHHENYINRKGFHSIVAQVECDHEMKFMSVNTGWPGSVHDARVFRNSKIGKRIIDKKNLAR
ncbi:uncharacterized protein LOC143046535 [Mytilus galloprovincialis]|uniref:uncharacterized protein LOC143046535 n=1 Tax=Mytilus galloprovincialis TaxID=29158 RepID=UPI003F7B82B8